MRKECYMDTVLEWLEKNPRSRARDIAEATNIRMYRISNALQGLVKKGVVIRESRNRCNLYSAGIPRGFGESKLLSELQFLLFKARKTAENDNTN